MQIKKKKKAFVLCLKLPLVDDLVKRVSSFRVLSLSSSPSRVGDRGMGMGMGKGMGRGIGKGRG